VLDRINGVAYVCLSDRADAGLAQSWADQLGYRVRSLVDGMSMTYIS